MALVDYSSDSDDTPATTTDPRDRDDIPRPPKKLRTASPPRNPPPRSCSGPGSGPTTATIPISKLPPLPPTFHDLYASTVRTAPCDDPALHQGRTRQTPHVPGLWPSHIYVEWRPPPLVHAFLCERIAALHSVLSLQGGGSEVKDITGFLQSDVGVPQPLHISLSRPLALSTEEKGRFLREVEAAVSGTGRHNGDGGGVASFGLRCSRVEWHRTVESGRSFLVLRVRSNTGNITSNPGRKTRESNESDEGKKEDEGNVNPELTDLLRRCNGVVESHGQPGLYRWAEEGGKGEEEDADKRVGEAFHVSIAWSFAEPTEELVQATEQVFGNYEVTGKIQEIEIPVEGIKVKIGNVVTHVALRQFGRRISGKGTKNLLGL